MVVDPLTKLAIITGDASQDIAIRLSQRLGCACVGSTTRVFPDGEAKITLESTPAGDEIIVVQSASPPVDSNLLRTLSMIHKARESSSRVIAVIPYMGYARQDREFLPGEIVTLEVVADLLQAAGATKIITVDMHSMAGLSKFEIPILNVSAMPALARHIKGTNLRDPLVVSPDMGGSARAALFAKMIDSDHTALVKERDRATGEVTLGKNDLSDVTGRDVVLVDDMISTGGSMIKSTELLKSMGCARIFVACTHALLVGGAEQKLIEAGVEEIISTNTIPAGTSKVDVSGIIADVITSNA